MPRTVKAFLYVDDLTILLRFKNIEWARDRLQCVLNKLQTWCAHKNLRLSSEKTKCMLFSRRRIPTVAPDLFMNKQRLEYAEDVRCLGVIMDNKLNWVKHIKYLREECLKRLNIMKVLAGTSWGADRKSLLMLYTSLIRSKLDYGCPVYSSARNSYLMMLDSVHHTGLRLATGAFRTSPIISICAEASIPPLVFRRQQIISSYLAKVKFQPNNPAYNLIFHPPHFRLYDVKPKHSAPLAIRQRVLINEISELETEETSTNGPPWTFHIPVVDIRLKNQCNPTRMSRVTTKMQTILQEYHNYKHIYTDGSKKEDKVGFAVIEDSSVKKFKLPSISSIYTAELQAIASALYSAISTDQTNFLICTDSLSALQSITNIKKSNISLNKIRHYIHTLNNQNKIIKFLWVPSHSAIPGNEAADKAAKEASSMNLPPLQVYEEYDIKTWLRKKIKTDWEVMWQVQPETNKLRNIKPTTNKWNSSSRGNRREEVVTTRLRIGHTNFTHIHLIMKEIAPKCETCNIALSIRHIIEDCPKYANSFSKYKLKREIPTVLGDNSEAINNVINILKDSGLFSKI